MITDVFRSEFSRLEQLEIDLLLSGLSERYGYDFRNYARPSLTRRIRYFLAKEGIATISELQSKLLRKGDYFTHFIDSISVHLTLMFRDPLFFQALHTKVLPLLRTYPFVRIWHTGCSTGEEVYSMAILLEEEGIYDRCRIYATDISENLIKRAEKGEFSASAMRDYTRNYHKSGGKGEFSTYYTTKDQKVVMRPSLKRNIVFSQHNLASDSPFNEFNLIFCRNVMIYFDNHLRDRTHETIYNSLGRFGLLALGLKESIQFTPHEKCYEELVPDLRIYRRTH